MDKIKEIISKTFEIDKELITNGTNPENIEKWDSLGQLSLIQAIEQEFQITFEISEIFEILTVGDIYRILQKKCVL